MTDDLPDHTNYSLIKAVDESGNLVTVLADSSGRIVSVMKGDYAGSMKTLAVDSAGRIITVIRDPTNDNYIAVDSNGNIVSVMKGDYAGTMKTLAVDSQGRIQAVLTDPEDVFGNPNYIGAGELAVRLGSIKSFEHRGNVIFMDDFESATLRYTTDGSGTGWSVARSNVSARSGDYSCKLTTGDAATNMAKISYRSPVPTKKRLGFECSFALGSSLKSIEYNVFIATATHEYDGALLYDVVNNKLQYLSSGGTYTDFATGIDLKESDNLYHSWKLVIDFETAKYVRAYLDDTEYDLSAYDMRDVATAGTPWMLTYLKAVNNAAGNHYAYIDDVIITQNEP